MESSDINPYWQILENTSKYFSEISIFKFHEDLAFKILDEFPEIDVFQAPKSIIG